MIQTVAPTLYQFEKIPTRIYEDAGHASREVAQQIANLIRHKASKGEMIQWLYRVRPQ